MTVAAIIQARMGSTRLSGKVLRKLAGLPIIAHVVFRLQRCRTVDRIVVATSTDALDDPLAEYAASIGAEVARGPEHDVLARYLLAARQVGADIVIRVTGDVPLIDPATVDRMVDALTEAGAEYAASERGVPCIHQGFSAFTVSALERLAREASDDPIAVEHVTAYFKEHPDFVETVLVPVPEWARLDAPLSVDTPADLALLERLHRELGADAAQLDAHAVADLLRERPEILEASSHVRRKGLETRSPRVVLRCDGGAGLGMGHVVRCAALAEALRDRHSAQVMLAVERDAQAREWLRERDLRVEPVTGNDDETLADLVRKHQPDALVVDLAERSGPEALTNPRLAGALVALIDDPSAWSLAADLVFVPPVPQTRATRTNVPDGEVLRGLDWVVLRRQFARAPTEPRPADGPILLCLGGADPAGLTASIVESLGDLELRVVIGPAHGNREGVRAAAATRPAVQVLEDVDDMAAIMDECAIAVIAFGVVAYESAARAVPALYLAWTDDHARSAQALASAGAGRLLGLAAHVTPAHIRSAVEQMRADEAQHARLARIASALVDGRGAERVAAKIVERVRARW